MARYLVVEDRGDRSLELLRAVGLLQTDGFDVDVDLEQWVTRLVDENEYPPERLASYDAFFVDCNLNSGNVPYGSMSFPLTSVTGEVVEVSVSTGMGVFLYLRQVMGSPQYRAAREADGDTRVPEAHLFSFVEIEHTLSKFYAPAALSWFGASHCQALPNPVVLAGVLRDLRSIERTRQATIVRRAVPAFEALIDARIADNTAIRWNHVDDRRVVDEMYDWLAVYLGSGGKIAGLHGFKEAVRENHDITCTWTNLQNQYAPHALEMQNAVANLLEHFPPYGSTEAWPDTWRDRDRNDPLYTLLNESAVFWTSSDVRAALMEHRARSRLTRRVDRH